MTARAQAFTLEAVVASLVVLGSLLFVVQAAGVTASAPSTASPQVGNQLSGVTTGTLDAAVAHGTLDPALRAWDEAGRFHGAPPAEGYYLTDPPTPFGDLLERRLGSRAVAYNVAIHYGFPNGTLGTQYLVRLGSPTDDAVRAARTVTLSDSDRLVAPDGSPTNVTLANASFYAPDAAPDSTVYNVVRVEVVAWPV